MSAIIGSIAAALAFLAGLAALILMVDVHDTVNDGQCVYQVHENHHLFAPDTTTVVRFCKADQ